MEPQADPAANLEKSSSQEPSAPESPSSPAPSNPTPAGKRILDLPSDQRPREKMLLHGPKSLTDAELLAIFFGTGTVGLNAVEVGRQMLEKYETLTALSRQPVKTLQKQKGIGEAKAIHLAAAFELGRRTAVEKFRDQELSSSRDVAELLAPQMRHLTTESIRVVLVNAKMKLMAVEEVHLGTVNEVSVHPREVFRPTIVHAAYAFFLAHNHPSGDPTPSMADRRFTTRIKLLAEEMQIRFLDHVIIGQASETNPDGYFSFRDAALL